MPVERISHIKGHKIFHDFSWPNDLDDFNRYNLIYGWNGTGKSTLASLFRHLQRRHPITEGRVAFKVDGREVHGSDFANFTGDIRVFNDEFIAENVFTAANRLSPIYVIGKDNIDKQTRLVEIRKTAAKLDDQLNSARENLRQAAKSKDDFCTTQARIIKETLGAHGNRFANYNKRHFTAKMRVYIDSNSSASSVLGDDARQRLLTQSRMTPKPSIETPLYELPDFGSLAQQASKLLHRTVASAVIDSLRDDPPASEWVHQGLPLHSSSRTDCLFCGQRLPSRRMAELEAHFSREFAELLQAIDALVTTIKKLAAEARTFKPPKAAELYDDLTADYAGTMKKIRKLCEDAAGTLDSMLLLLERKKSSPFDSVADEINLPELDSEPLSRLRQTIQSHNDTCEQFNARIEIALSRLEDDYIARAHDEYSSLTAQEQEAQASVAALEAELTTCRSQQHGLERDIVSHREPADELNRQLRAYLGHSDLQLEVKETGYIITRKGEVANALSEGERTAIAVLYFLKSLRSRDFDIARGIVVLDDPVSSLDANSMFNAFAYIKDHTNDAKQVFLLTHNFGFFRAVREWFNNLRGQMKNQKRIFMLATSIGQLGRCARLAEIDCLLRDYESEYHYLFAYIYRLCQSPPASQLEEYLPAPMIARRVLETFLAFRVPHKSSLHSRMTVIACDETVKSRIYRFVNTHAHKDGVGDMEDDLTILSETQSVLKTIIDFMRIADAEHCDRMIECVSRSTVST